MINKEHQKIMKQNTCRTIVNVPIKLDEKFEDLAIKRGISKSQMIIYAMSWYLDYVYSNDLIFRLIDVFKAKSETSNKFFLN